MLNRRIARRHINSIADVTLLVGLILAVVVPVALMLAFPPAIGAVNLVTPLLIGAGVVVAFIAREIAREIADRHYFG